MLAALTTWPKKPELSKALAYLVVAAVLFTVSSVVATYVANNASGNLGVLAKLSGADFVNVALESFLVVLLGGLFLGWVHKTVAGVLGGKGEWVNGLTVFSNTLLPVSIGVLLLTLVAHAPLLAAGVPTAALTVLQAVGFILFTVFAVWGFAGLYRGTKELLSLDWVPAILAVVITALVVGTGLLLAGGSLIPGNTVNLLPALPGGLTSWGLGV